MAVTICCNTCDWTTDIETISETNPHHCPECGGDLMLASNGMKSDTPLYVDGEYNQILFADQD